VEGEHGGGAWCGSQGALEETGRPTGCEPRGGVGMSEGRDGPAGGGEAGPGCGLAAGALATGATPGRGRRSAVWLSAPRGGKAPGLVPGGCPGSAEQSEGSGGEGDGPVCGALAAVDRALETLASDGGALQGAGRRAPESSPRARREGDLVVSGGGSLAEAAPLCNPEDGREPMGGWRTQARQGGPGVREDVRGDEAETTVTEAQGSWGQAIDVGAREARARQCRC
jgi:hypothetical protein